MGVTTSKPLPDGVSLFSREFAEKHERQIREMEERKNPKKPEVKIVARAIYKPNARDYTRRRVFGSEQEYGIIPDSWGFRNRTAGYFLENGGRLYLDCSHPEYASPEASNPLEAIVFDKAGELIVQRDVLAQGLRLFKNNRDIEGNLYGSHESYSLRRSSMGALANFMVPFLTTRIIFCGAGIINKNGEYELSQRADKICSAVSQDTTCDRPIFNTRDETLGDANKLMRMHVISGDANLSETALFLKYGTAGLVLDLFEDGKIPRLAIHCPENAIKSISRDLEFKQRYEVEINGFWKNRTAIDVQRTYLELAEKSYRGRDAMTDFILDKWNATLDALAQNPMQLSREIDWVIKMNLMNGYMRKTGKTLQDSSLRDIDLQYHELGTGFFQMLQGKGLVERLITDEAIEHASLNPPSDTRAWIRGKAVAKGIKVEWNSIGICEFKEIVCQGCSKHCVKEKGSITEIDNPLDNYSELEKELAKNGEGAK